MEKRQIVYIDEAKCDGCGICIPSCAEGAIRIIDGKAKLMADNLCDGLGACLGHCPQDAITIIEREAASFDEEAVKIHLEQESNHEEKELTVCGCPGSHSRELKKEKENRAVLAGDHDIQIKIKSQLTQWPVQLMLVPPTAPYFEEADLLVTADCVPFAYANYHLDLLKGKKVVVGCPKLDNVALYAEKLTQIIKFNHVNSITVAFMEVPCCTGIVRAVEKAVADSGLAVPIHKVRISLEGDLERL